MFRTMVAAQAFMMVFVMTTACQAQTIDQGKMKPASLKKIPAGMEAALFAGGCFWCMEAPFDKIPGVLSTTSGYTDGFVDNPAYRQVANGVTGHTEAVQIVFDPKKISYEKLLYVFWRNIDPTAQDRQFCDGGTQYRSGIYTYGNEQLAQAKKSLKQIKNNGAIKGTVYTEIKSATRFYPAEEYHQDFYKKRPGHYKRYRLGCRRDARLKAIWGDEAGG